VIPLTVREARLSDSPAIAELISQLGYPTTPDEMAARLEPILSNQEYITFLAEVGGEIVGLAGARLGNAFEFAGGYARLTGLVVGESWRSKGIGELLLDRIEVWAREQGVSRVILTSSAHRKRAHQFYLRHGYQETGLRFAKLLGNSPKVT
jgi:GNAT superfamily N-acetyltransferase